MSQDFTTTLRLQLREAAEREARRGPLRRALPERRALAFAAALAAAAVAVVLAIGASPHKTPAPADHAPHVVAHLAVAQQGGALSTGFGSLWAVDPAAGAVIRLSPSGGVAARIPLPGNLLDGWAGAGAMWALTEDHLFRIDPATNRIAARIQLPPPSRSNGSVSPFPDAVWVGNSAALLHVDPRTNRIDRSVSLERGGLQARGVAVGDGAFYVRHVDGTLATLAARTGRQIAVSRPAVDGNPLVAAGGIVAVTTGAGVAAVDARTGKLVWRANLGVSRVNYATLGLGSLWIQGTPPSGRDQLWRLDPKTGRVIAALPLPDFGAAGMTATRDRLWIMSPGGELTAIR